MRTLCDPFVRRDVQERGERREGVAGLGVSRRRRSGGGGFVSDCLVLWEWS